MISTRISVCKNGTNRKERTAFSIRSLFSFPKNTNLQPMKKEAVTKKIMEKVFCFLKKYKKITKNQKYLIVLYAKI